MIFAHIAIWVVGGFLILSAIGTLIQVALSLLCVPFALLNSFTRWLDGKTEKMRQKRLRLSQERILNAEYERIYFPEDA